MSGETKKLKESIDWASLKEPAPDRNPPNGTMGNLLASSTNEVKKMDAPKPRDNVALDFDQWRFSPEAKSVCESAQLAIDFEDWKSLLVIIGDPLESDSDGVLFSFLQCCLSRSSLLENFLQVYKEGDALATLLIRAVDWYNRSGLWTQGKTMSKKEADFDRWPADEFPTPPPPPRAVILACKTVSRVIVDNKETDLETFLQGELASHPVRLFSFFQCCLAERANLLTRVLRACEECDAKDTKGPGDGTTGSHGDLAQILADAFAWYLKTSVMWA